MKELGLCGTKTSGLPTVHQIWGTLETHLDSLFYPDTELQIQSPPPLSWKPPPFMVTCSDQAMGEGATKQKE